MLALVIALGIVDAGLLIWNLRLVGKNERLAAALRHIPPPNESPH